MTHSGGKPHRVGDKGQRYEVTFFDPNANVRKIFGWAETRSMALLMVASIEKHPSWTLPEIRDRRPDSASEPA